MDEGLPVTAKRLVLGENPEQKKEERVAVWDWSFVKELKTDKQEER